MKRFEILQKLEDIMEDNRAQFVGTNEAELFAREEMADFMLDQIVLMVNHFTGLSKYEVLMQYYSENRQTMPQTHPPHENN